jgi:hypothetical protein
MGEALSSIARSVPSLRIRIVWFCEPNGRPFPHCPHGGILRGLAGLLANDAEHGLKRPGEGFFVSPPYNGLSDRIQIGDTAIGIRCNDRIADAGQSDTQ